MPRPPKRRFPNIVAVTDPRSGVLRGWRAQLWVDGRLKREKTRTTQERAYEDAKTLLGLRERLGSDDDDDLAPGKWTPRSESRGSRRMMVAWVVPAGSTAASSSSRR